MVAKYLAYLLLMAVALELPAACGSQGIPAKPDKRQFMSLIDDSNRPTPAAPNGLYDLLGEIEQSGQQQQATEKSSSKKKGFSGSLFTKKVKEVYKDTKNLISQEVASVLKLDSRGRLKALIDEVKGDIKYVRREFSLFTIPWSPMVRRALNYIGATNLNRLQWDKNNDLDFSHDALKSLAMGYEFMRIMMAWRENMLVAHEAYKLYLESLVAKLGDGNSADAENKFRVDDDVLYRLKVIHNYMLLAGWLSIEELVQLPMAKLEYLIGTLHEEPAGDFESQYLRDMLVYEEMLKLTMDSFKEDHQQMIATVEEAKQSGRASEADFEEVDEFFDDFRDALAEGEVHNIVWEIPYKVEKFMNSLTGQLQWNPLVYQDARLLSELKKKAIERQSG